MLFTFPSRYLFTIGRQDVFSLGKWTSQIPTGLACPVVLRNTSRSPDRFRLRGCHPLCPAFPVPFNYQIRFVTPWGLRSSPSSVLQPPHSNACELSRYTGLGLSLFARHYSGNNFFSSRYLDVSVPSVPSPKPMCSARVPRHSPRWVSPFGHPRIDA